MSSEPVKLKSVVVKSLADLLGMLDKELWGDELMLFRGQNGKFPLLPGVARGATKDTKSVELKMLQQLRLQAASHLDQSSDDLEMLVVAQHHSMKTRLLDWTGSVLTATWFACSNPVGEKRYVYALEAQSLIEENLSTIRPFHQGRTVVFQPRASNPRVIAQDGWFSLHKFATNTGRFVPLEENGRLAPSLREFVIPKNRVADFLVQLDRAGVSARTVYPDLEGVCRRLNWKYLELLDRNE